MHAMTEDPANRSRLYLTDREVRAPFPPAGLLAAPPDAGHGRMRPCAALSPITCSAGSCICAPHLEHR